MRGRADTSGLGAVLAATLIATAAPPAQQLVERSQAASAATKPESAERMRALVDEVSVLLHYDLRLALQRSSELIRLARLHSDDQARAIGHAMRARAAVKTIGPEIAKDALAAARDALPADASEATCFHIEIAATIVHWTLDEVPEALAALRKALDHAEASGQVHLHLHAELQAVRIVRPIQEAEGDAARLVEKAASIDHPGIAVQARAFQAIVRLAIGQLRQPEAHFLELMDEAERLGERSTTWALALNLCRSGGLAPDRQWPLLDRALGVVRALGDREQQMLVLDRRAQLLAQSERPDEAKASINEAIEALDGSGMLERQRQAQATAAYLATMRGDPEAARRHGDQARNLGQQIQARGAGDQRARIWHEMSQLRADMRDELDGYRQAADDYAERLANTVIVGSAILLSVLGFAGYLLLRNQQRLRRANEELQEALSSTQRLQEERETLANNLQQIERLESIGLLAGGFAHDFNNILVSVRGNAQLLLGDERDDDRRSMLEEVLHASDRASGLCKDILNYAHATPSPQQPTDMREVLEGIAPLAKAGFGAGVEVTLDLGDTPRIASVDPVQIEQVFLNILVNAGDAIGERGHIHVSIDEQHLDSRPPTGHWFGDFPSEPGAFVAVSVLDNGQGMDAETIRRIFDPFFSTRFAGRGLGLAAVFGILRRHDGIVEVQSRVGQGTQFTIYLPARREDAVDLGPPVELQRPELRDQDPKVDGATILVVDDEPEVCSVVTRLFERRGHAVLTAHGGLEALELFECCNDRVAIALLDVTMPDMDGQTLARHLRSKAPELPIVLMTGHAESAVRGDDLDVPLVLKPFDVARLAEVIRDELATRA